jgi:hypothetical protein
MELLLVGSCTGEKDVRDCPNLLTETDFDDPSALLRREAELSRWALPAVRLYMGWQHRYMMMGVNAIRERFGSAACALKIISAGYGLVDEDRNLVPYEATFQSKRKRWIHDRAQRLGIPQALRQAIRNFETVIFLLGKEYLLSTLPLRTDGDHRSGQALLLLKLWERRAKYALGNRVAIHTFPQLLARRSQAPKELLAALRPLSADYATARAE